MLSSAPCQLQKETEYPRKSKRNFYLPEMAGFITHSLSNSKFLKTVRDHLGYIIKYLPVLCVGHIMSRETF